MYDVLCECKIINEHEPKVLQFMTIYLWLQHKETSQFNTVHSNIFQVINYTWKHHISLQGLDNIFNQNNLFTQILIKRPFNLSFMSQLLHLSNSNRAHLLIQLFCSSPSPLLFLSSFFTSQLFLLYQSQFLTTISLSSQHIFFFSINKHPFLFVTS